MNLGGVMCVHSLYRVMGKIDSGRETDFAAGELGNAAIIEVVRELQQGVRGTVAGFRQSERADA